ncbi:pyridoxal phosphate-dependent transferase [Fusarium oxysporum f. sp. albedinis]|nr:pyridoxal phosphate-dependent transferase [Fusarium oxysporum f. sp. albedinis]
MAINGYIEIESCLTVRLSKPISADSQPIQAAKAKASRDFRSDVVTVPVEEMMEAILAASVNDDIYDAEGNPSVKALEAKMVELTGMEAALWAVSGTQGNQICLRTHLTQPPHSGSRPVAMHLDAARVIDSVVAEGVSLKDYAACFDSMSICLAKGIGASMGSVIVGSKRFIERSIHALAKRAGSQLEDTGYRLALPAQSNMVVLDLAGMDIPGAAFVQYCADAAVAVFPNGRLVFHHQTSEEAVADLVNALKRLLQAKKDGKALNNEAVQGGYIAINPSCVLVMFSSHNCTHG